MKYSINRYIPKPINNFIKNRIHCYIKWDKDLSSKIYSLDSEGLIVICDTILRVAGSRDLDKDNYVEIPKEIFRKILHDNYTLYLDYLIEENIVLTDNQYIVGEKSRSFKLNEDYIDDLDSIKMSNQLFTKRTIKAINESDGRLKVSIKHKHNFKNDFRIDFVKAYSYLTWRYINQIPDKKGRVLNKYTKAILEKKLLEIKDNQLFISRNGINGRITTNLSLLNHDFKQFIIGYDTNLDICASQPSMLVLFINLIKELKGCRAPRVISYSISYLSYVSKIIEKNLGNIDGSKYIKDLKNIKLPTEDDIKRWTYLCEYGDIYEEFAKCVKSQLNKKISRADAKQFFITIMYSHPKSSSQLEYTKVFVNMFPSIYKFINTLKLIAKIKRSHKMFPIILQATESFVWVENILPELDKMNIQYHFIHDSVIVKQKDTERTNTKIEEQFYLIGLNPQIKREKLLTENNNKLVPLNTLNYLNL